MKFTAEPTPESLHLLATTIAQRHTSGHEGDTADDEHLARKSGIVASLGELIRRSLLLACGSLCSCLRDLGLGLRLGLRLGLGVVLVVLGLCGSQGILGIAKLGQRGGIGVVGIGQLGIGVGLGLLQTLLGVDGGLIASIGSIELWQLILRRPARVEYRYASGKGSLVVDVLKIGLKGLISLKLGLGIGDGLLGVHDCLVGGLELVLSSVHAGDSSLMGCLGVIKRLLSIGVALECGVRGVEGRLGRRDLLLCGGKRLLLVGDRLLRIREGRCRGSRCGLGVVNASLGSDVGRLCLAIRLVSLIGLCPSGIALGGKVLDRSGSVAIRLVGLIGLCLGGVASAASLCLTSSSLVSLRLAVGERGILPYRELP